MKFRECPQCKTKNNPTFSNCWKCGVEINPEGKKDLSKPREYSPIKFVIANLIAVFLLMGTSFFTNHDAGISMTIGVVFLLPFVLGMITVFCLDEDCSWAAANFAPWITVSVGLFFLWLFGREGAICLYMAAPIFFIMSSLGGSAVKMFYDRERAKRMPVFIFILFLPLLSAFIETNFKAPDTYRTVRTQIMIHAPEEVIWKNIIRVPKIQQEEQRTSFFHLIGFPRPVEATLSHEGVGGVRHATFEGGVDFTETITEWKDKDNLVFSIKANTESIPSTTLDQHVKIGGEYFDMLQGQYQIEKLDAQNAVLHLSSTQRLSTRFNVYSGLWTEAIMRSIQNNILEIIKNRCEAEAKAKGNWPPSGGKV